jgi:hypothetical protein
MFRFELSHQRLDSVASGPSERACVAAPFPYVCVGFSEASYYRCSINGVLKAV